MNVNITRQQYHQCVRDISIEHYWLAGSSRLTGWRLAHSHLGPGLAKTSQL